MNIRKTVLQEGMNIFQRHGIKSLSLEEIIAKLDISKGTFFEIARSREELLEQCIGEWLAQRKASLTAVLERPANPLTALQQLLRHHLQAVAGNHPDFLPDLKACHPDCWKLLNEFSENQLLNALRELVKQSMEAGLIWPEVNTDLVGRLWLAQGKAVAEAGLLTDLGFSFDSIFEAAFGSYLAGISTPQGLLLLRNEKTLNSLSLN